jgi:hypothetical protein
MLNKLLAICLFFVSSFLFAQKKEQSMAKNQMIVGTSYFGNTINEHEICDWVAFTSKPHVSQAIEKIVKRSGLKQNFYVMECPNTDNCFAATRNGERLIVYDPAFMNRVNNFTKNDWASLSILAHEIGHHLQGHTIKQGGSEHKKELEADEFSGFVMYQMGATLREAQSAIFSLTHNNATSTHPPKEKRMKAIELGYLNAQELYPSLATSVENRNLAARVDPHTVPSDSHLEVSEIVIGRAQTNRPIDQFRRTGCVAGSCRNGFGTAVNAKTFETYTGEWQMGKRHGFGKEFDSDGGQKFEGFFYNGLYHGQGILFFPNGEKYQGGFYQGKMHGTNGSFVQKDGTKILVNYVNGKKEGRAKVWYSGGREGVAFFRNDIEVR